MSKVTYSVKTIESRDDQEIGISSRREIMGDRKLEDRKIKLKVKFDTKKERSDF